MKLTKVPHFSAHIISDLLYAYGVKDVVVSPGSRNAPLVQSIYESGHYDVYTCVDERFAGFFALGKALSTNCPVVLVCTSGTAVLNYAPAVSEAYYKQIPLIVISADRPYFSIDRNEVQTIRQFGSLGNIVKNYYNIDDFDANDNNAVNYCELVVNEALGMAVCKPEGPVHINVQFDTPLISGQLVINRRKSRKILRIIPDRRLSHMDISHLADEIEGKKILFLCGVQKPDADMTDSLIRMSGLKNCAVLAENISNVSGGCIINGCERVFSILDQESLLKLRPDIVITLGGSLVCGRVKSWIKESDVTRHWHIGYTPSYPDTFGLLTIFVDADPVSLLSSLYEKICDCESQMDYRKEWMTVLAGRNENTGICWSDFTAVRQLIMNIPEDYLLFLSNGTTVRYAEFLQKIDVRCIYSNRGVSGIDGTTSTAIGIASSSDSPLLLITGDMSLRYDLGFLISQYVPDNMKIAVINNSGGGIFRGISTTSGLDSLEEIFTARNECRFDLEKLCTGSGWKYIKVCSENELSNVINDFYNSSCKTILEIFTDSDISVDVFRKLYNIK